MPTTGIVRELRIRPSRSSDLSFNMPGILAIQNYDIESGAGTAHLGRGVQPFDIETKLYAHLGETVTGGGGIEKDARLMYNSSLIRSVMTTSPSPKDPIPLPAPFLFALRNETLASALDQAIERREIAFLERFKHAPDLQKRMKDSYPEIIESLKKMLANGTLRCVKLEEAYCNDLDKPAAPPVYPVVRKGKTSTYSPNMAMVNSGFSGENAVNEITTAVKSVTKDAAGTDVDTTVQKHVVMQQGSFPRFYKNGRWQLSQESEVPSQRIETEVPYTIPRLDNQIAYNQLVAAAHNDLLRQEMSSYRKDYLERIMRNELAALDLEIRALQLNFAHTFLYAPFNGLITAVYKDIGESVDAGEPVVRIEDNSTLFAVGQIQFRGVLGVGNSVKIIAQELFERGDIVRSFEAQIVSIRGHQSDDDEWDLIMEFKNPIDADGNKLLPLNYTFDAQKTRIEVS